MPPVVKEFLIWFGVIASALNLAFTGGVIHQRVVYLEAGQTELKTRDAELAATLKENDGKFTAILVSLAKIEERLPAAGRQSKR